MAADGGHSARLAEILDDVPKPVRVRLLHVRRGSVILLGRPAGQCAALGVLLPHLWAHAARLQECVPTNSCFFKLIITL